MIYQTSVYNEDGHKGYEYFTNKTKAVSSNAQWDRENTGGLNSNIYEYPNPNTLKELIKLLNRIASHNDNG